MKIIWHFSLIRADLRDCMQCCCEFFDRATVVAQLRLKHRAHQTLHRLQAVFLEKSSMQGKTRSSVLVRRLDAFQLVERDAGFVLSCLMSYRQFLLPQSCMRGLNIRNYFLEKYNIEIIKLYIEVYECTTSHALAFKGVIILSFASSKSVFVYS